MKKQFLSILLVAFILLIPRHSFSQDLPTQKFVLDNGLTVLVTEMPGSSTVSVFGLVKTGSVLEGKYLGSGISHFMEHMLFKGTQKRGVGQISKEVQALGGVINASTSFDYTIYTLTMPQAYFDNALDIISDMLMNSKFDAQQIQKERDVVYGEMRLYKDNPERYLSQLVFDTVYKKHPYRIPVIGYEELLHALTREDFVDYYRSHYMANNTIISIAGRVKAQDILPKVKEAFKTYPRLPYPLRNIVEEPEQISSRYYETEYPTEITRVSMGYAGVGLLESDMFAMDILAMILGQGETSRLYQEIYLKKGLVRSISASNFTPLDRGVFEIEAMLDYDKLKSCVQAIKVEIQKIMNQGVSVSELEKTKRQVVAQHLFSLQTSDTVANAAAADEAFTGDYDFSKKYVEAVKKITVEDIKRVAKKYLQDERLSLVVLKPKAKTQANAQIEQALTTPKIEKMVLPNGLTILLRENKMLPLVSINLILNGGSTQESPALNGLCELTSRLWTKGTKSRSAEWISENIESRGGNLSPFAGRNSFGLTLGLLSEDLGFGLDLLEDLVKNPAFPEKHLTVEKDKLKTTLISMEDSISSVTSRNLRKTLFLTHPYRMETLGSLETLDHISRSDLVNYYQQFVVPNNMVLTVFGDINAKNVLADLQKRFGNLNQKPYEMKNFHEPPPAKMREQSLTMNKKQAMVMIGFQGVDFKNADRYGIEVMASVLGSPFSGRIFNTVRDQFGQAYTLGGGFTPGRDTGTITFYVLTTDEHVEQVKDILLKLIKELREKPVSESELKDVKEYLKGSFDMDLQTDFSLSFTSGLDELYGLGFENYQSFNQHIDAITPQDVKRLAMQYLDPNRAVITMTRPTQEAAAAAQLDKTKKNILPQGTGPGEVH